MPRPASADLRALLAALTESGVEFIVVGGAAAVIHGAPITTQDVDVVPRLHGDDRDRWVALLASLDTRFRPVRWDRDIAPTPDHFAHGGQLNLITSLGPLDVLCRLHDQRGYDELLAHTIEVTAGDVRLRVIDLPTLITIKLSTGRARDQLVVPLLRAIQRTPPGE